MIFSKLLNLFKSVQLNQKEPLDGDELKKVLVSSMYAEQQSAYLNSYTTGLKSDIRKNILQNWWGIHNREEALDTLEYLLYEGYAEVFPAIFEAYENINGNYDEILENRISPERMPKAIELLRNLRQNFKQLKDDKVINNAEDIKQYGIAAWDYGRGAFIARLCYDNQYISLEELKKYLDLYYKELKKYCTDWEHYTKSYIIGRALWGGEGNSGMVTIADDLLTNNKSPLKNAML